MLNQGQVRDPGTQLGVGTQVAMAAGRDGQGLVSKVHGDHYAQNLAGNVYFGSTDGAGAVFSIYSNASFTGLLLWNPAGSGKNLSVIRVNVGIAAQAATAITGWGYSWQDGGNALGTAAPMSAFTDVAAAFRGSCVLTEAGGQGNSVAKVGEAATFTAAMGNYRQGAFSTGTAAITVQSSFTMIDELNGTMIVPPGIVLGVTSGILGGSTAQASIIWEEIPA